MRPVEPIDEPAKPIRACATVAPVLDLAVSTTVEATEPDPQHHRAREGVWARAAVLSGGVAGFPTLDLQPPSLPWIHAAGQSE